MIVLPLGWLVAVGLALPVPAIRFAPTLASVALTHRLEIVTGDPGLPLPGPHGATAGRRPSPGALKSYSRLFAEECSLLPPALVAKARLRRVVFCEGLSFAGQLRAAVPDFAHDTLYLDVARGSHDRDYLRRTIHHDFFHMVDYRDDGVLYGDKEWAGLNPADFRYGTGGRNAQGVTDSGDRTPKYPGFLTHYSTTGVEEDKAEVFAHLIVHGNYVAGRCEGDRVLRAKVARLKQKLKEFCPEADAAFWRRVGAR